MPLVSVIMSVYNEPQSWLQESVSSILNQTFKDFEFIIIDDNPSDQTIKCYLEQTTKDDSRVIIIYNKTNIGLTNSLNIALSKCKGDYIVRMDADDISIPNRFEEQISFLESNREISVCYSNYSRINEDGDITCVRFQKYEDYNINYITFTNPIGHSTVMFRKEICQLRAPLYNELFRRSQDYELWSFLYLSDVKFGYIDKPLLKYRVSRSQVTSLFKSNQDSNLRIIRKQLIRDYLVKRKVILPSAVFSEITIIRSIGCSPFTLKKGDALYPVIYMLYYGATKKSYQYAFFFLWRGLTFKYGFRKTLYLFFQPFFKTKWDIYLI